MSEKKINSRIINKHDIEAHWTLAENFIPMAGEIIIYDRDANNSLPRFKVGDGETQINELPFMDTGKMTYKGEVSELPASVQIGDVVKVVGNNLKLFQVPVGEVIVYLQDGDLYIDYSNSLLNEFAGWDYYYGNDMENGEFGYFYFKNKHYSITKGFTGTSPVYMGPGTEEEVIAYQELFSQETVILYFPAEELLSDTILNNSKIKDKTLMIYYLNGWMILNENTTLTDIENIFSVINTGNEVLNNTIYYDKLNPEDDYHFDNLYFTLEDTGNVFNTLYYYADEWGNKCYTIDNSITPDIAADSSVNVANSDDPMFLNITYEANRNSGILWAEAAVEGSNIGGEDTVATRTGNLAYGIDTLALGEGAQAFGRHTQARGNGAAAFGLDTKVTGRYGFGVGEAGEATGYGSFVEGDHCKATNYYSHAGGFKSEAHGTSALAFGDNNVANGRGAVTFGDSNEVNSINGFAAGAGNDIGEAAKNSAALGGQNQVDGTNSVGLGQGNVITGDSSSGIGSVNRIESEYSHAIGHNNNINNNNYGYALGMSNTITGRSGVGIGNSNTVSGERNVALGISNTVSGNDSLALGEGNTISETDDVAIGTNNSITHRNVKTLGTGLQSTTTYQTVIGRYNDTSSTGVVSIGVGWPEDRKNAVDFYENQNATFHGFITAYSPDGVDKVAARVMTYSDYPLMIGYGRGFKYNPTYSDLQNIIDYFNDSNSGKLQKYNAIYFEPNTLGTSSETWTINLSTLTGDVRIVGLGNGLTLSPVINIIGNTNYTVTFYNITFNDTVTQDSASNTALSFTNCNFRQGITLHQAKLTKCDVRGNMQRNNSNASGFGCINCTLHFGSNTTYCDTYYMNYCDIYCTKAVSQFYTHIQDISNCNFYIANESCQLLESRTSAINQIQLSNFIMYPFTDSTWINDSCYINPVTQILTGEY